MAQKGNISSWAGQDKVSSPEFVYEPSEARLDHVSNVMKVAFPKAVIASIGMLRNYDQISFFKDSLQGNYLVELEGGAPIVAHIKESSDSKILEFGADVFDHLKKYGVKTTQHLKAVNGDIQTAYNNTTTYFTDFLVGEHPFARLDILDVFGESICNMEWGFQDLPNAIAGQIKNNSGSRYKLWRDGFNHWAKNASSQFLNAHIDTARVMRQAYDFISEQGLPEMKTGVPNHFDLIEANTLITTENEAIVMDCDTILSGWSPAHYDLGTFAFRVGLNTTDNSAADCPTLPSTSKTLEPLCAGYNRAAAKNGQERLSLEGLIQHAKMSAALHMLTILGMEAAGTNSPELSQHTRKMTVMSQRAFDIA